MEAKFADTFFESLEKLTARDRWYYKVWEFFTDGLPTFFRNVWVFRKALYQHRWYDWRGDLQLLRDSIQSRIEPMMDGMEIREFREKKIQMMERAVILLTHAIDDTYIDQAEEELGSLVIHDWEFEEDPSHPGYSKMIDRETPEEKAHNKAVFERSREIQSSEWKELWSILQGTKYDKTIPYEEQFDGTDIRGWWD